MKFIVFKFTVIFVFLFIFQDQVPFLFFSFLKKSFELIKITVLDTLSMLEVIFEFALICDFILNINSFTVCSAIFYLPFEIITIWVNYASISLGRKIMYLGFNSPQRFLQIKTDRASNICLCHWFFHSNLNKKIRSTLRRKLSRWPICMVAIRFRVYICRTFRNQKGPADRVCLLPEWWDLELSLQELQSLL